MAAVSVFNRVKSECSDGVDLATLEIVTHAASFTASLVRKRAGSGEH